MSKSEKKRRPARPRYKTTRRRAAKQGVANLSPRGSRAVVLTKPSVEPLPAAALRWRCDPQALSFDSTTDIEPITGVIGQDSAVDALKFGLETSAPGQNVFVRGITGTGRMTLIRRMLEQIRLACPAARDRCYIHNFVHPDRPRLLTLYRGQGKPFQHRMDEFADYIRDDLKAALSSQAVIAKRTALEQELEKRIEQTVGPFEKALHDAGLALMTFQVGPVVQSDLVPRINGKPVAPEEFEQMHAAGQVTDEQVAGFKEAHAAFQTQFQETGARINEIRNTHAETLNNLWKDEVRSILTPMTDGIARDYPGTEVRRFLDEIIDDVVNRRRRAIEKESDFTRSYRVNAILAHEDGAFCEIIVENTPTMSNLLGSIDHISTRGEIPHSDHLMIRAGSLLRADGGYLVIEARDVLREPGAWHVLMRTLRTGRLEIVPPELVSPWAALSLKPEPIDVNVKVVLLGESDIYYMLDAYDPDFPDLFKVLADFARVVPHDEKGLSQYAGVLARIAKEEGLLPFDRTAVAALIEHGARIAADKGKLTTRFGRLADIAREAAFICNKEGARRVTGDEVAEAVRRTKQRADLPSRRFREMIADGTIRIETSGTVVGQINGLAVITAGPLTYGFPARITATIGPGTAGVINIERESALSGSIHTKGFYILGGLLRHLLRTVHPLVFDASIAFEQSYGSIDGDSASGAEICCMLSALTDIPLRQDLAMTGAIDQVGHILAVGAVNEKIEGFFDTCRDVGLTGAQGVIIPGANAGDLMLREDVVEACAAGWFHVYAVNTVQEALECLTLMPAGVRKADGRYPEGTVLGAAVLRAWLYWVKVSQTPVVARRQPAEPTVPRVPARRKPRRARKTR